MTDRGGAAGRAEWQGQNKAAIELNRHICHRPATTPATFPTRFLLNFLAFYSLKKGFSLVNFARQKRRSPAIGVVRKHEASMRILELVRRERLAEELATDREAEKEVGAGIARERHHMAQQEVG